MSLVIKIDDAFRMQEIFREWDRDYYSFEGYKEIIEYFEQLGEDVEFDVVAICCDFEEEDFDYIKESYSGLDRIDEAEDIDDLVEALNWYTWAVRLSNDNILYINF